jgi:2-phospho-L-lactate guanylyltransferase
MVGPAFVGTDGWTVVVPAKSLARAKSRLGGPLAEWREQLALAMLLDTVTAALGASGVHEVRVVTADDQVVAAVRDVGAAPHRVRSDSGINETVRESRASLPRSRRMAVLPGDLPALRSDDLADVLAAADNHPRAFVADAWGTGTTLLMARTAGMLSPAFGPGSADRHAAMGYHLIPASDSVRCDVDAPEDLLAAAALGLGPCTSIALDRAGLLPVDAR